MADWQVLLITGPAGAGKTTTARYFASTREEPTLYLSLDDVRGNVLSGLANPSDGWNHEVARQYGLAQQSIGHTARLYAAAGFKVVIDDAIFPEWPEANLARWHKVLQGLAYRLVVLLPRLDVVQARNTQRSGVRLLDSGLVKTIYDMMLPWRDRHVLVIDNSDLSLEQTARQIVNDLEV
jgi:chloramphenicol 3-O-phosphotransferase